VVAEPKQVGFDLARRSATIIDYRYHRTGVMQASNRFLVEKEILGKH